MSTALQEMSFISRMLLAAVFLVAAAGKSRAPRAFARTIQQLGPRPSYAQRAAWLVMGYEGIIGLFLALGLAPLLTAAATLSLLLLFVGVSIYALVSHQRIPCNCFGQANVPLGGHTLTRTALLLMPTCALAWSARSVTQPWWPDTPALLIFWSAWCSQPY